MTPDEKAHRMEDAAERPYSYNISKPDADIAAEAAYFRAITPDANGLLPCPMCGPDGRPEIFEEIHNGMTWYRVQCGGCALVTARKYTMPAAVASGAAGEGWYMSEYTIAVPMHDRRALEVIRDAINNPDSLHDMVYAAFRGKVPDWAEHGWELRATLGVEHIFVTARRKT